ncbi:MAG: hypothetical protein ACYSVY_04315 [Planctomycetota bacterium]|jgi:hypothetical protein
MAEVDKELLEILVCPQSKASLVQVGDWLYSTDPQRPSDAAAVSDS